MHKKTADEKFNMLYHSTFDDAVAYVTGITGSFDIVEKVLTKTYGKLYCYLRKEKNYDQETAEFKFLGLLKELTSDHIIQTEDSLRNFSKQSPLPADEIMKQELDITESEFLTSHKNKKIHSYIMSYPKNERKIYILYFYCSYSTDKIASLLNYDQEYIENCISHLLVEIKDKFFKVQKATPTPEVKFDL